MNQYWVNFITNGDPNGEELAQWPEADENMGYIDFGAGITVHSEPLAPLEELMEELYALVEKAVKLPLSGGRTVLDGEEVKAILDEMRDHLPQETRQARAIVADRTQILADAKKEAESIIRTAEERAKKLISQDEITRQAQAKATEMLAQTQARLKEMKRASNEYLDDLLKRTEDSITTSLNELKQTRQNIKASLRSGQ